MIEQKDFSRQSFLGPNADEYLANARIVVVGLGGGGSHIVQQLAHIGVGEIRVIDPDVIEASNLNRLIGATADDVALQTPKVAIAERLIQSIRSWIKVPVAQCKWQDADGLIKDAHLIFGCLDGYRQRDYLEGAARRFQIPLVDIGMNVTQIDPRNFAVSGQVIVSLPAGPCMRCLGFLTEKNLSEEENRYGDAGINPQVVWANGVLASAAVGEAIKLLTPWFECNYPYRWLEYDGNAQSLIDSRRPEYQNMPAKCPHHGGRDGLGDPFFKLRNISEQKKL